MGDMTPSWNGLAHSEFLVVLTAGTARVALDCAAPRCEYVQSVRGWGYIRTAGTRPEEPWLWDMNPVVTVMRRAEQSALRGGVCGVRSCGEPANLHSCYGCGQLAILYRK